METAKYWDNQAESAMRHASLCLLHPDQYQPGKARDPEYWKAEAAKAREVANKMRSKP